MELKDLSILAKSIQDRYRREFKPEDCVLPSSFKSTYQKFNNNDQIEYFEYSLIVHSSSSLDIYIPNQWIYIAYYFVEYYKMLKAYKETLSNLVSKEDMKVCNGNESKARALLSSYDGQDKEYLVKFLSDYSWWGGGKTIDRNDYYVSPILSLAGLVNASQSYIADICKNLAESDEAYNELDYSIQNEAFNPALTKKEEEINYVIVRELKDHYTSTELANELAQMQNKLGYSGIHLFALKFAHFIKNENLKDLCRSANIPESYSAELNKMRNLYNVIKNKQFGVAFYEDIVLKKPLIKKDQDSLQIVYYGAPGTGKSFTIDKNVTEENSIRTTFHPDSDYASFVGAYKPTMEDVPISAIVGKEVHEAVPQGKHSGKEKKIVYKYVPQAFLKAYVESWKRYADGFKSIEPVDTSYYLIIEEINRGNCAQIFGDLFQLLDRNNMGASSYPIRADEDIARFLKEDENGFDSLSEEEKNVISNFVFQKDDGAERSIGVDILNGQLLLLPPNLHIWATMNTSDQSLFPIDSAFKRRWDWKYTPIDYAPIDKETKLPLNWKFQIGDKLYNWGDFLAKINFQIEKLTESPDKQMGYFFAKANPTTGIISEEVFKNKVLFFLWTEVLKDYNTGSEPFINPETTKTYKFTDFFDKNQNALKSFIEKPELRPEDSEPDVDDEILESKEEHEQTDSASAEWYKQFWTRQKAAYEEYGLDFNVTPSGRPYYERGTGVANMQLENKVIKKDGSCWVGLYMRKSVAANLYPKILPYKEEINAALPFSLEWIPNNDEHGYACIRISKSGLDYEKTHDIETAVKWMAEHGVKIFNVFKPYFERLK